MSVIEKLMETAEADTDVLYALNEQGDRFALPRDVEFILTGASREQAEAAAGFLAGYQYASTTLAEVEDGFQVLATVHMPVTQQVLLSVSGFMACVAELYALDYDGWGCVARTEPPAA